MKTRATKTRPTHEVEILRANGKRIRVQGTFDSCTELFDLIKSVATCEMAVRQLPRR